MTLRLTVYRATPSMNEFHNVRRAQAWKYRALRRAWLGDIGTALLEARSHCARPLAWPRPPRERVHVCITRYAPAHHWLDADNLAGGMKPVLDALKAHALIRDDGPRDLDVEVRQDVSPTVLPRWTEIRLDIAPPDVREVCY